MEPEYFGLVVIAIALDALIGSTFLGRLMPSPDRWLYAWHQSLAEKLDKTNRSDRARATRGLLACIVNLIVAFVIGAALEVLLKQFPTLGQSILVLLLTAMMGQRSIWALVGGLGRALDDPAHADAPAKLGAARWGAERLALRFSDALVANSIVFILTGPIGLLMFRVLSTMMAAGAPSGIAPPQSPYYRVPTAVFQLIAGVLGGCAAVVLSLAVQFAPKGRSKAFTALIQNSAQGASLIGRRLPLQVFAFGFDLNFRRDADVKGPENWIGPAEGRARLSRKDLTALVMTSMVATLIMTLLLLIFLGLILVP